MDSTTGGARATEGGLSREARDLAWIAFLGVGLVAVALYVAYPDAADRWLFPLFGVAASVAVVAGIILNRPPNAKRWAEVGGGIALLALGDLTYTILEASATDGVAPFPSLADAVYLAGYAVLAIGLAGLIGNRRGGRDVAGLIDALIVAASVGVVAWVAVLSGTITEVEPDLGVVVALAYPFMDLMLLTIAVRIALVPAGVGPGRYLIAGGVVAYLISDFLYAFQSVDGTYTVGGPVDGGWMVAYVLWGAAALHPRMIVEGSRVPVVAQSTGSRLRLAGLAIAALVPLCLLWLPAVSGSPEKLYGVVATATLLTVLVFARIASLFGDLDTSMAQRGRLEGQLRHAADHDPLVGLWNRRVFHDRLSEVIGHGEVNLAALFIDLDDFKSVNDSLGHSAGDIVLAGVAQRIEQALRPDDVAARLGGDEFGVILRGCPDADAALAIAERLRVEIGRPISTDDRVVTISASIGVAHMRGVDDDADALMGDADIAMYLAKERGKDRVESYVDGAHLAVRRRLELRNDLENALAAGQFTLVYQPIVDLQSDTMIGVEALLRWDHPQRGRLAPSDFLGMLEERGLIVEVGRWVVTEACRQLAAWKRQFPAQPLSMSVNLSPLQLRDPSVADDVIRAVAAAGIEASDLIVEITESVVLDLERSLPILERLRRHGVRIALDDFGTGYSTITNLVRLPLDILKVDQSFIAPLQAGSRSAALIEDLLHIAASMGVQPIAEGIEVTAQREALVGLGCRFGQGFLLGFPGDPEAVSDMLADQATGRPHRPPSERSATSRAPAAAHLQS